MLKYIRLATRSSYKIILIIPTHLLTDLAKFWNTSAKLFFPCTLMYGFLVILLNQVKRDIVICGKIYMKIITERAIGRHS